MNKFALAIKALQEKEAARKRNYFAPVQKHSFEPSKPGESQYLNENSQPSPAPKRVSLLESKSLTRKQNSKAIDKAVVLKDILEDVIEVLRNNNGTVDALKLRAESSRNLYASKIKTLAGELEALLRNDSIHEA